MGATIIILLVLLPLVGLGIGFGVRHYMASREQKIKTAQGDQIIEKAKNDANEIKYKARKEAKEQAQEEREKFEREMKNKENEFKNQERELVKKEASLDQKHEHYQRELATLKEKQTSCDEKKTKYDEEIGKLKGKQEEFSTRLAQVAGLTRDEAKAELIKSMEEEARVDFAKSLRRIEEEAKEESEKKAKRIIGIALQRFAGEFVAETTISSVDLPSDDIKGRLIGREGRNIRAFEQICGVDMIIDDTPGMVVLSSFNVVRKEIARQTLMKLIADGRVHPAKIEEFYEKTKGEMDRHLRELGEKAQMEIGVHGIHPEILKLIGALNFRTSYTQNQYQHALECAFLAGNMAGELGFNVKQARRAALLHDIGKVIDASQEGSHAVVGADFAKKYGESPDIVHAIRAHHDDEKPESVLAFIIAAADALSGGRPGARKAMMESYVTRLSDIEKIVTGFEGVANCYAISGGREVRVLVENERVTDEQTVMLSRDIAKKIENELSYPGTIRVTVLRETKAVGVAR